MSRKDIGESGEDRAVEFLEASGMKVLKRNERTRFGEIDIIAQDGPTTVFVEVKKKSTTAYGLPEEMVGAMKAKKLIRLSSFYAASYNITGPIRIDVVAIDPDGIRHYRSAVES